MYLCARTDAFDTWALCKILRIPYTCHITKAEVRAVSGCPHFPTWQRNNASDSLATSHAVLRMKTITVQLLLRFASLHQTGNDLQEDPTTCGSEQPNRIGDCRTSDLSRTRLVWLWTRLCSSRWHHEAIIRLAKGEGADRVWRGRCRPWVFRWSRARRSTVRRGCLRGERACRRAARASSWTWLTVRAGSPGSHLHSPLVTH